MTVEEFDRILTALRHTGGVNLVGMGMTVPLRAVIEIVHSNLHQEDKDSYVFDWQTYTFKKKLT